MAYQCKILADSINPRGNRLTTFELTYPRFVHAEFMTHRMFSRNAASSRAIPIEKMVEQVLTDPAEPIWWGKNQSGMQAREELDDYAKTQARGRWLHARNTAVTSVRALQGWDVHKQIVNRLLEPWMWITVIASATHWGNFFHLRCHPDAQPEIRHLAELVAQQYRINAPVLKEIGEWHLPLIGFPGDDELSVIEQVRVSVGRCARVSYLTHDGRRDVQADLDLCDRLAGNGHWSPFEHVAVVSDKNQFHGNFEGWIQYRKYFPQEHRALWPQAA